MFTSIIVAVDGGSDGERALPIVRALEALGDVDVELLTVAPPSAGTHGGTHAQDVATTIAAAVNARPEALLVMATSAKPPFVGHLLGSVSEAVLRLVERPVLLVGPHVPGDLQWTRPTPIVCVRSDTAAPDTVAAVLAFGQNFRTAPPRIVEVVPGADERLDAPEPDRSAHLRHMAGELAVEGVDARYRQVRGGVPEIRLEQLADQVFQPFFVVASARWTGGRHWHSTARQLVSHTAHPVLVVPVRSAAPATADRPAVAAETSA
jgi:Universal stress protein family